MTESVENIQNVGSENVQNVQNDKEQNLGRMRQKYEYELAREQARREQLEQQINELKQHRQQLQEEPEDDTSEPYVDHKKLEKKLNRFGQHTQSEIKNAMQLAKEAAKEELKEEMFLDANPDFENTLSAYSEQFAQKHPKLASSILKMPPSFERQKLVYQNIKELGLDRPAQKPPSIQEKIDSNRKAPYYQPSSMGNAPYVSSSHGDFSTTGQKSAYDKMQDLKSRLRLG